MATSRVSSNPPKRIPKSTPAVDFGRTPADLIDARIRELQDWRGEVLAKVRAVILATDPQIIEEWKWNVPVWSCVGIICTGETYKKTVKLTFAKGAQLEDPDKLFNSSLEGNTRRAIDFLEGSALHEVALATLVRRAVAQNRASASVTARSAA